MKIYNALMILALAAGACKTTYYDTSEPKAMPQGLEESIAKDVGHMIEESFPPAQTRILFAKSESKLSKLIDTQLRERGYALSEPSNSAPRGSVQLAYKLSIVGDNYYILRLVAGEGYQINRVYQKARDGKIVASGPVLMRRGE